MHGLSSSRPQRSEWNCAGAERCRWSASRSISKLQLLISEQELRFGVGRADTIQLSPCANQGRTWYKDDLLRSQKRSGNIRCDRLPRAIRRGWQKGYPVIESTDGCALSQKHRKTFE